MPSPWPEKDARLRELWATGLSTTQIAIALGLGPKGKNKVIGRKNRLDLPRRPSPIRNPNPRPKRPRKPPSLVELMPMIASPQQILLPFGSGHHVAVLPVRSIPPAAEGEGCRWIIGSAGPRAIYCDAPLQGFRSYCPEHYDLCWVKGERRSAEAVA